MYRQKPREVDPPQDLSFKSLNLEMNNSVVILLHLVQSCLRYYFHPLAGNAIYLWF